MDPQKPKSDTPKDRPSAEGRPSAEERVERLSGAQGPEQAAGPEDADSPAGEKTAGAGRKSAGRESAEDRGPSGAKPPGEPPRLTERQRREARERRRSGRRTRTGRSAGTRGAGRPKESAGAAATGNALSRGLRATGKEVRRTAGYVRGLILTGLDQLGPAVRTVTVALVALFQATGRGLRRIGVLIGRATSGIGSALLALDRLITPRRALIAVAAAAVVALVISQFTDFRATEIGQPGYDPIRDITGAPQTDVLTPMDAHSVVLLMAAAGALAGVIGAAAASRRLFGGLVALAGAATVAVALLIDLPRGLDVAEAEISYSGVAAVLLSGFWIELAAGLVLFFAGIGLLLVGDRQRSRQADRERKRPDERSDSRTGGNHRDTGPRPLDAGGLS